LKEQKSAKSEISRRNFLFLLEDAETAKIFAELVAKVQKASSRKTFLPPLPLPRLRSRLQLFRMGQIVGIINSDCRFRFRFSLFVVAAPDPKCYIYFQKIFNEIESVSNYIL
jgi:hypothetical protein